MTLSYIFLKARIRLEFKMKFDEDPSEKSHVNMKLL